MDILTGSLDDGAKEGGLIVTLGFQAKEHFLWIGAEPSVDTVSLDTGAWVAGPTGKWRAPQQACISERVSHTRGELRVLPCDCGTSISKEPQKYSPREKSQYYTSGGPTELK